MSASARQLQPRALSSAVSTPADMHADDPHPPAAEPALPASIEERAGEILLGPPEFVEQRFAELCAANVALVAALARLRADFERAAHALPDAAAEYSPQLPPAIGPYRFLRQIGEGAFGVVFLAEQSEPIRREVAIKLLHTTAASRTGIARFLVERETLARMNHPAIARIFDAGVDAAGRPYFVMEYVPGEPLHRFVATRAAGLHARLELFLAACEGVNHAHQRGVIHRDLKPQNILVSEVDGRWLPKVIDFGLAKVVEDDGASAVQTRAGAVLGTPAYMSPEQVRGDAHEADTRTDVYALGVILYELLTSSLPLGSTSQRGRGFAELQRAILEDEPPLASVRAAHAGLPHARSLRGDLDWILRKAMAKREAERYASVAEFAADVRRHLAHEPVAAQPPSASYALRKFVRRHRGAVLAAGLVFVSLLLGLLVSASLWREADHNERRAREHLADFWRLADVVELEELAAAEKTLWPSLPDRLAAHEQWLERARGLVARRALHATTIDALQARLTAGGSEAPTGEELRGARFLLESLQKHVAALDAFGAEDGACAAVAHRAEFARTVEARSITEPREAWAAACARVAASPRYGGLRLQPVLGLVPLGPDLDSGLEEFAHLQSGTVPPRDASGALRIADDTAIVLVLMPGGDCEVGTQSTSPGERHYDPSRTPIETDCATAHLPPYLLGKFELTQGQVKALGGRVQALGRMGTPQFEQAPYTPRHPEESVLGPAVMQWLPHFELRLPSIFEWEAAARAGTSSIWGVGDRPEDLQGFANVADATLADQQQPGIAADRAIRDGFQSHAPVGSFAANAFGMHDMIGNVAEMATATMATGATAIFARGGSFRMTPVDCRIGSMRYVMPNQTTPELGVRVCRGLPQ